MWYKDLEYLLVQEEGWMWDASDCDEHWDYRVCGTHKSSQNIGKPSPDYEEWNVISQHELVSYLQINQNSTLTTTKRTLYAFKLQHN